MAKAWKFGSVLGMLVGCSLALLGQIQPIPNLQVQPIPIPGGDSFLPDYGLYHQFFPGPQTPPYDPPNSDPHGITNFRGVTAMGYTLGQATDNHGNPYAVITDIRVYVGDYVGAVIADPRQQVSGGWTKRKRSHGTFVEI
jgi:hypothetical protein